MHRRMPAWEKGDAGMTQKRRRLGLAGLIILFLLAAFSLLRFLPFPQGLSAGLSAPAPSAALLAAAESLDSIEIDARFDPDSRTLTLRQLLHLTHPGGEPRDEIILRAYPNAFQQQDTSPIAIEEWYDIAYPHGFSMGALSVSSLQGSHAGEPAQSLHRRYLDAAKTTLQITLPFLWEPQSALTLDISYTLYLPQAVGRFGLSEGIWTLGNTFLIPALYENGRYRTDPYEPLGDPFLSDCANYTLRLSLPSKYACAASAYGIVSAAAEEGRNLYTFQGYALRDFALCLSENFHRVQSLEGEVLISAYATDKKTAERMLTYAKQALSCFSSRYGAYPYPSLSLAEAHFPIEGAAYPGLILINSPELNKESAEWLIAGLTARQWWSIAVGIDPINQPWQQEALSEYCLLDYAEDYYGPAQRETLTFSRIETAQRITIPGSVTPGSPLFYFESQSQYLHVVRHRGAALFCALNEALEHRLDDFLRAYYDKYRFSRASREDLEALLKTFSGEDWSPLFVDYLDTYTVL